KEKFEKITKAVVLKSGLIIKTGQSWLCASPDGLLENENSCLEIKCPFSCKDSELDVPYIKENMLVKNHPYYTQVQLQMYVSNSEKCYLFVFSPHNHELVVVQ
ncbi:MAG: hypothetical protein FJ333_11215, partial [Sphingomonadales bacterium]|nr:hypothetical protein [Sphingomonadales bacterium]